MIKFMLFDVDTRRLRDDYWTATTPMGAQLQCDGHDKEDPAELSWVAGHYENVDLLYVDHNGEVAPIGNGGPLDPSRPRQSSAE